MRNVAVVDKIANRIRWGYLTAFILLLSSYILTFYTTRQLLQQSELVNQTNQIINTLEKILSEIKDAETGIRGYYLVNDEKFLDSYKQSHDEADESFNKLTGYLSDKPDQKGQLDTLRDLIQKKYAVMESGLNAHRADATVFGDTPRALIYKGKALMDNIKERISRIETREQTRSETEKEKMSGYLNAIKAINIASLVVAVLLAFYAIITFNKENNGRKEADANADAFRQQLETQIAELDKVNKELVELRSIEKFAVTGRISRTIAHEVRNPLTNINLAAEHLRSEIDATEETDLLLEMITRNANRINVLISDLLNSTKAAHLNFEKASITKILDESLDLALDRIKLHNIKVQKQYMPGGCEMMVDAEKIKIAFLNIIVNAVEAMDPDNGVLSLKTENKHGKCVVIIQDNGKGMDKESLSKLFEPYFTTKENGNGLGLTNTHNIILNHKASIYAESEVGKGTKLTITFSDKGEVQLPH